MHLPAEKRLSPNDVSDQQSLCLLKVSSWNLVDWTDGLFSLYFWTTKETCSVIQFGSSLLQLHDQECVTQIKNKVFLSYCWPNLEYYFSFSNLPRNRNTKPWSDSRAINSATRVTEKICRYLTKERRGDDCFCKLYIIKHGRDFSFEDQTTYTVFIEIKTCDKEMRQRPTTVKFKHFKLTKSNRFLA